MPAFIGPAIIEGLLAAGVTFGAGAFVASTVLPLAGAVLLSSVAGGLASKPRRPGRDLAGLAGGRQEMIRSPVVPRRTIYGTALVSGPIVYAQTFGSAEGIPNAYLSLIVALAGHEVEAIDEVWFGDARAEILADGVTVGAPFSTRAKADSGQADVILNPNGVDFARVYRHLGTVDQAADARLVADSGGAWTGEHRLRGIAYVHVRLLFDRAGALFSDGVPKVRCRVRGRRLHDPRTGTAAWSNNPALVVRDYLTTTLGIAGADIDDATVTAAANLCDETVPLKNGATQRRYTCNGAIDADDRPVDVLRDLLGSMAGTLVFSGGKFRIHAGAAATAALTLDEDDLAGPLVVHPRLARRELYNGVKAMFIDERRDWQPQAAPVVTGASYAAEDGGAIVQTLDLPFTIHPAMAQRLAKVQLLRARQPITVEASVKPVGLRLAAWDTVRLTNARLGWDAKLFRVVGWSLDEDLSVRLSLREEADSMWAWSSAEETEIDPAPDTLLADPRVVAAPGALTIAEELRPTASGGLVTVLAITAGPVGDGLVADIETQIAEGAGPFRVIGRGDAETIEFAPARDGTTYTVRARAINHIGARSPWTTATHTVAGQNVPPADVTNFAVNIRGAEATLTWDPVADVDLSHYRVRWASTILAPSWSGAIDLVPRVARPATSKSVPALTGTYLIKAVDLKGNESVNAASIQTTIAGVAGLNVIDTVTEDPAFAGTHAGTAVDGSGRLHLNGADTLASWTTLAGVAVLALGLAGALAATGSYTFGPFDLGAVDTARLTPDVLNLGQNYANTVESWASLAAVTRLAGTEIGGQNLALMVRRTDDDPAGAPTWTAWAPLLVGDYRARAFQFRADLARPAELPHVTPLIERLRVGIDMTDRIVEQHDLASGTDAGGFAVTFAGGAFRAPPALGVSAQGMATGDFYEFVAKGASGFTIRFKDSGGTVVSRTFDYIAKGYGVS